MGYRIEDIEGIGPANGEKLAGAGIKDTDTFLRLCAGRQGRKEIAGKVDTVKELRHRNAENLAAKMKQVQREKRLTRTAPGVSTVSRWVARAKQLEPIVSH